MQKAHKLHNTIQVQVNNPKQVQNIHVYTKLHINNLLRNKNSTVSQFGEVNNYGKELIKGNEHTIKGR